MCCVSVLNRITINTTAIIFDVIGSIYKIPFDHCWITIPPDAAITNICNVVVRHFRIIAIGNNPGKESSPLLPCLQNARCEAGCFQKWLHYFDDPPWIAREPQSVNVLAVTLRLFELGYKNSIYTDEWKRTVLYPDTGSWCSVDSICIISLEIEIIESDVIFAAQVNRFFNSWNFTLTGVPAEYMVIFELLL